MKSFVRALSAIGVALASATSLSVVSGGVAEAQNFGGCSALDNLESAVLEMTTGNCTSNLSAPTPWIAWSNLRNDRNDISFGYVQSGSAITAVTVTDNKNSSVTNVGTMNTYVRCALGEVCDLTLAFTYNGTPYEVNITSSDVSNQVNATSPFGPLVTDTDPPVVQSIAPVGSPAANASSMAFRVTFDENANNVSTSDFTLVTTSGDATGTIANVSASSGTTIDVTVNGITGDGGFRLDLSALNAIYDDLGNGPPAAFPSGVTHTVDRAAPVVPPAPDMTAATDTGVSNTDNITSNTTPAFSGIAAEPGSTVSLFSTASGGTLLGSTTADGGGNWTVSPSSALSAGSYTVYVTSTDAAGNASGQSTTLGFTVDTSAPEVTSISRQSPANSPTAASSLTYRVVFDSDAYLVEQSDFAVTGPTGASLSVATNSASSYDVTVSGGNLATYTGTADLNVAGGATITDVAGNALVNTTPGSEETYALDNAAPSGYGIAFDTDPVNAANDSSVAFTFSGAEASATYNYTISSSGGGANVTGNGTISTSTDQITGIDTSGLGDGTLTLSVTLTDPVGNTGGAATDTVTKATVLPSGYSIAFDQSVITPANRSAASFTFTGAQVNATYNYTITSSGGAGFISNTGTITSANQQITNIDVSGLSDGTLTASVTLTDPVGNTGGAATDTVTKDVLGPIGYSVAFDQSALNAANTTASFTFTGAEVGADYAYSISSSAGGTPLTGSGTITSGSQQISGVNASSLPDGTLTLSVVLTDTAGNAGSAATDTVEKDIVTPSGYTVSFDQASITAANETAVSFSYNQAETGVNYSYTITSSGGAGSVTNSGVHASAPGQVTGIDVSSLPDGDLTLSYTQTDTAGNTGSASTSMVTKESRAPATFSMALSPSTIIQGETSTLTFTIDNTASGTGATALDFTLNLPAGLLIASTPNTSTTCTGGTATTPAGGSTISFTGSSVGAAASCTLSLDVTTQTAGGYVLTTGNLTSSLGNSGTATANLTVTEQALSIGDVQILEGDSGSTNLVFTVQLAPTATVGATGTVRVDYATQNGTAIAGQDYTSTSGALTFGRFTSSQNIQVPVTPDTQLEPDETFSVVLSNAVGARIDDDTAVGTIQNDEADTVAPVITSITRQSPAQAATNADTLSWAVTFSEPVTDLRVSNIDILQGSTRGTGVDVSFTGSDANYVITAKGGSLSTFNGEVKIAIAAGTVKDAAGNLYLNTGVTGANETYQLDRVSPTVSLSVEDVADNLAQRLVTVSFSEAVSGLTERDLEVENATVVSFERQSGSEYAVIVEADGNPVVFRVPRNAAQDAAGNRNTASETLRIVVDTEGPLLSSIELQGEAVTNADAVSWRVTFSEPVINVDSTDFDIQGVNGLSVSVTQDTESVYEVGISGSALTDFNGTVQIALSANAEIADALDNPLTDVTVQGANENNIVLDNIAPVLTLSAASDEVSEAFTLNIETSEALKAFTVDDLTVENATLADFSASGANTYTVTVTPEDFGALTVSVSEGQVQDAAGNSNAEASLSLTAVTAAVEVDVTVTTETEDPTSVKAKVDLFNPSITPVRYNTESNVAWLTVSPAQGTLQPGGNNELSININERILEESAGIFEGVVFVLRSPDATTTSALSRPSTSGAGAQSPASDADVLARIPVRVELEPRRGTIRLVTTTPAGVSGEAAFVYASDIEDFDGLTLNTSAGQATSPEVELERGTYTVTQTTPAGWRIDAISCAGDADEGSSFDLNTGVLTLDLDSNEALVCTIENVRDEDLVRLATQRAIRNFMLRRADRIIEAAPDLSERLTAREQSGAGGFSANMDDGRYTMAFKASLAGARNQARERTAAAPGMPSHMRQDEGRMDVWLSAELAGVTDNRAEERAKSDFGVAQLGVDWAVSSDLLIGVMAQYDWMDEHANEVFEQAGAIAGAEVSGEGWMAGPYVVWRMADTLVLDGLALYGSSDNQVNPLGFYEDDFETDRFLLRANLTGEYTRGAWALRPQATLSHYEDQQKAYTDSFGIAIPGQTVTLGRLAAGPEVRWRQDRANGGFWQISTRVRAVWDYNPADLLTEAGVFTQGQSSLRADGELGLGARFDNGAELEFRLQMSGLGDTDFEANAARINLRLPLSAMH